LDTKVKLLGVAREQAEAVNCVSGEIAEQMAIGVCSLFGAKVGLATTGYAEKSPERAVSEPFAWWAIAHDLGDGRMAVHSSMVECPGSNRASAQEAISIAALSALVRYLRSVRQKG
jgi:nicotinamide-nucleotide amidase